MWTLYSLSRYAENFNLFSYRLRRQRAQQRCFSFKPPSPPSLIAPLIQTQESRSYRARLLRLPSAPALQQTLLIIASILSMIADSLPPLIVW